MAFKWREATGIAFFVAQVFFIANDFRKDTCALWTPFHETALYSLEVTTTQTTLRDKEALTYFSLPTFSFSEKQNRNWETNCMAHVAHVIRESMKQNPQTTRATLTYSVNGNADSVLTIEP
jgi:hypothetical protein